MKQDPSKIIDMANAYFDSCVLFTACDLGIFSYLAKEPHTDCNTIAKALTLDINATVHLLDACVALELLEKKENKYNLTPDSIAFLSPDSPSDLTGALKYNRDVYNAWGKLNTYIKTGENVEKPEIHLGEDEKRTEAFVMSMHYRALGIGRIVVPQLELSNKKQLLDIGGGPGTFSVLISQAYPEIKCTVIDLPDIITIASRLIKKQNRHNQVKTLAGDYHALEYPMGNDVVNFFGVLHQESPESITNLLKKAYNSLLSNGTVYIMDMMTNAERTAPKFSTMFSINMALTTPNGWVFSEEDLKGWCSEAGFVDFSVKPVGGFMPHWIGTAKKI